MNLVKIVTENGFVINPDFSKDLKNKKAGRIFRENILPRSSEAAHILEDIYSFKMLPGIMALTDVEGGHLAMIKAPQYSIGKNFYDLEGYGIPCVINRHRGLFPLFRQAHMAERFVYVDKELKEDFKGNREEIQACLIQTWPQVIKLEVETATDDKPVFTPF